MQILENRVKISATTTILILALVVIVMCSCRNTDESDKQLFSNWANEQADLLENGELEQYSGCFIENNNTLVICSTLAPNEFKKKCKNIIDIDDKRIDIRKVQYTLLELQEAMVTLQLHAENLYDIGVIGFGLDEPKNAVNIVVPSKNEEIIAELSKIINNMGIIVFEIGE